MIRVTLRQFRNEGIVGLGLLVVLGVVLLVTGLHLAHVNDAFLSTCRAAGDCSSTQNPVLGVDKPLQGALPLLVMVVPALVGIFFGAPLIARELESGTFRLAWTQSVTRQRWLTVKLALVGAAAMTLGGLVTWMATWWARPLEAANENQFGLATFGVHGVAPLGYAAFGFALGACAGVLLRRTVAAMVVALLAFAGARLAFTYWIRSRLASPLHESLPLTTASAIPGFGVEQPGGIVSLIPPQVGIPNGWVYSTDILDNSGHALTSQDLLHACPALVQNLRTGPLGPPKAIAVSGKVHGGLDLRSEVQSCLEKLTPTFHTVVTYQPASRFWPFQWMEMGIFLAAAVALCGLTFWWLRRQYA